MFDAAPHTPQRTSWTVHLLQRLDAALGPGVWEKPMFDSSVDNQRPNAVVDSSVFREIGSGAYDLLFPQGSEKLSELYRATQVPQMQPTVRLVSSAPFAPLEFPLPAYPPLAKVTYIEGTVSFDLHLNSDSSSSPPILGMGHPFLQRAVESVIGRWKFPKEAANRDVHVAIEFTLNCKSDSQ